MEPSLGLGKPHSQYVVSDVLGIETLACSSSKCKHILSVLLVEITLIFSLKKSKSSNRHVMKD